MVIPELLWDAVNKIQDTLLICPPAVSQHAAMAALRIGRSYAGAHLPELNGLRRSIFEALGDPDVPCDVPAAGGAFYYLVRVHSTLDPLALTERLIRNHKVAVIPGSAFGDTAGCSIRISYGALRPESVSEGVGRLVSGLRAECGSPSRSQVAWVVRTSPRPKTDQRPETQDQSPRQSSGLIRMFL